MKHFTELFSQLDQSTGINQRIDALVEYFTKVHGPDKIWAMAVLSDQRPKRIVNIKKLRTWAHEIMEIPDWLFEESYQIVGDIAETIALVLPKPTKRAEKSFSEWIIFIKALGELSENEKKQKIIEAWNELDFNERFVFNKLITGGWRMGVSRKLMIKSLSKYTGIEGNLIANRLMESWTPDNTDFSELVLSCNSNDEISKPYPFSIACDLEGSPEALGQPEEWIAERKWDGIRGQVIVRGGELFVWSGSEELITDKVPEYQLLKKLLPDGTVIEGEIIPFKHGKILPLQKLQTRLGRKNLSKKLLNEVPVAIIAYDILEYEGRDYRKETQLKRREVLEKILSGICENEVIMLSDVLEFDSWNTLYKDREKSRLYSSVGLMIKRKAAPYHSGKIRRNWFKWKVDPMTVDAVLIYAMRGQGVRSNLYTDYTFAVWKGNQLIPFAKAFTGLEESEFLEISNFVRENTIERFGPVRSVKPELVFEIAFDDIQESSRHKSGISLRFPRMLKWRKDKSASEANSLEDLVKMLNQDDQE